MATTQAELCNMALSHIGVAEQIVAITDDNAEANHCNLWFGEAQDKALAAFDWAFARRRITLVVEAGTPPEPWTYQYQYPDNCIRPIRIDDKRTIRQSLDRIRFTTETNSSNARIIYTHMNAAVLIYTYRETTYSLWPTWFVDYFTWQLAARLAGPLLASEKAADRAERRMLMEKAKAISEESESEQEDPEPDAPWIAARDSEFGDIPGVKSHDYWVP